MDQKGHITGQKGPKMEFLDLENLILAELGGTPLPPERKLILPKTP